MRREQVRNFGYLGERSPLRLGKLGDRLVEALSRSAVASALRRSASESGRLRHRDRGQGPGDRRRMALMSTILSPDPGPNLSPWTRQEGTGGGGRRSEGELIQRLTRWSRQA